MRTIYLTKNKRLFCVPEILLKAMPCRDDFTRISQKQAVAKFGKNEVTAIRNHVLSANDIDWNLNL